MADASLAMKEPPALADAKPPVQSKMEKEMGDLCGWNKKKRQKKLTMIESMNLGAKALALTRGARCRVIGLRNASRYNGRVGVVRGATEKETADKPADLLRYSVSLLPRSEEGGSKKAPGAFDAEVGEDGEFDLDAAGGAEGYDSEETKLLAAGKRKVLSVRLANLVTLMYDVGPELGAYGDVAAPDEVSEEMRNFAQECVARAASLERFLARPELPALRASGDLRWKSFVDGVRDVGIIGFNQHLDVDAIVGTVAIIFGKMRDDPWVPPPPKPLDGRGRNDGVYSKASLIAAREKRAAQRAKRDARREAEDAEAEAAIEDERAAAAAAEAARLALLPPPPGATDAPRLENGGGAAAGVEEDEDAGLPALLDDDGNEVAAATDGAIDLDDLEDLDVEDGDIDLADLE